MTTTSAPQLTTGTWTIDPSHSEVGFTVRHLGLSKVRGRFNSFTGGAQIGADLASSTVEATIDLASVDTNNEQRDGHLRSTDFFAVETHPQMTFRSAGIEISADSSRSAGNGGDSTAQIEGELTINGVTKTVVLEAELHGVAVDAYGTTRAGFSATTQIKRSDFGIDFNVPLDAGGVLIGDKVTVDLEIQLVPEEG